MLLESRAVPVLLCTPTKHCVNTLHTVESQQSLDSSVLSFWKLIGETPFWLHFRKISVPLEQFVPFEIVGIVKLTRFTSPLRGCQQSQQSQAGGALTSRDAGKSLPLLRGTGKFKPSRLFVK